MILFIFLNFISIYFYLFFPVYPNVGLPPICKSLKTITNVTY